MAAKQSKVVIEDKKCAVCGKVLVRDNPNVPYPCNCVWSEGKWYCMTCRGKDSENN